MTGALAGADVGARRRHQLRSSCACSCWPARARLADTRRAGQLNRWPRARSTPAPHAAAAAARRAPDERDRRALFALVAAGAARGAGVAVAARASRSSRCAASRVEGDVTRNSVATIRANAAPQLAGNFFTHRPAPRRGAPSSRCPGCARPSCAASGRTAWRVRLEEHRAGRRCGAATSGDEQLVNSFGEVFEANVGDVEDDALPTLAGPDGSSAHVLAMLQRARAGAGAAGRARSRRSRCRAAARGGPSSTAAPWSSSAAAATTRWSRAPQRFVAHADAGDRRATSARSQYADLRHDDGYAVRLKGVSTTAAEPPTRPQTKNRKGTQHGQGIQGSRRRPGHRHRQGDGGGGRGAARRRAAHRRPGQRAARMA